jgi:hypothetical protein
MGEVIKMENTLGADWMQRVRYMGNEEFGWRFPEGSEVRRWCEAGAFHVEAVFPFRGVLRHRAMGMRPLCVWRVLDGERVSTAIREARELFELRTRREAQVAFVRCLPKGGEAGMDVYGCALIEADWVGEGCVVLG